MFPFSRRGQHIDDRQRFRRHRALGAVLDGERRVGEHFRSKPGGERANNGTDQVGLFRANHVLPLLD